MRKAEEGGRAEQGAAFDSAGDRGGSATPALVAREAPLRTRPSAYPEPFAGRMRGRHKRPLSDLFGLRNFGVNLTTLDPGAVSALQHRHSLQDEFIYVLDGEITLVTEAGDQVLSAGMCFGFPAGGDSHHLENRSPRPGSYLEIGDRTEGDEVSYPFDDLVAVREGHAWRFLHKSGAPYEGSEGMRTGEETAEAKSGSRNPMGRQEP